MRISLSAELPADSRRAIADGAHRALVEALGVPEKDRFQIVEAYPAGSLVADGSYLGVARRNVVFVQVWLVARSTQMKAALFAAMAKHLAAAGVRREDVFVVLTENGRADWSLGNGEQQLLDEDLLRRHGWTPPPAE